MAFIDEPVVMEGGDGCARKMGQWVAFIRCDISDDHRLYARTVTVDELFLTSRPLGDDPILRALGGTFHLSGYRDFCPLSIVS